MRKKIFNKQLLNEEIKKFRTLSEYAFYEDRAEPELDKGEEILLGDNPMIEAEDDEEAPEEELSFDDEDTEETPDAEEEAPEEPAGEETPFGDEETPEDEGEETPFGDEEGFGDEGGFDEEPAGDEVELDVTELVKGSEEAKASADAANAKIDQLMGMVNNMTSQLQSMDAISNKIDSLENELEKRAPTPEEKIEMRSLDSYPYNIKLSDFWSEQEGQYDIIPDKKKEYVLDKDAIDSDYSDSAIKGSFDADNEYEEEDF